MQPCFIFQFLSWYQMFGSIGLSKWWQMSLNDLHYLKKQFGKTGRTTAHMLTERIQLHPNRLTMATAVRIYFAHSHNLREKFISNYHRVSFHLSRNDKTGLSRRKQSSSHWESCHNWWCEITACVNSISLHMYRRNVWWYAIWEYSDSNL